MLTPTGNAFVKTSAAWLDTFLYNLAHNRGKQVLQNIGRLGYRGVLAAGRIGGKTIGGAAHKLQSASDYARANPYRAVFAGSLGLAGMVRAKQYIDPAVRYVTPEDQSVTMNKGILFSNFKQRVYR